MSIEPRSAEWIRIVTEIRDAFNDISDRAWRIADLVLEIIPEDDDAIGWHCDRLAEDVGYSSGTLRTYRRIAIAYPPNARNPNNSFYAHKSIAGLSDRFTRIKRPLTRDEGVSVVADLRTGSRAELKAITPGTGIDIRMQFILQNRHKRFLMQCAKESKQSVSGTLQDLIDDAIDRKKRQKK